MAKMVNMVQPYGRNLKTISLAHLLVIALASQGVSTLQEWDQYELNGTVYMHGSVAKFEPGIVDVVHGDAYGIFHDGLLVNGWGVLDIKAGYKSGAKHDHDSDTNTMYAAGYLEGTLTHKHIYTNYLNLKQYILANYSAEVISRLRTFIDTQMQWMTTESRINKDRLWQGHGLTISLFLGVKDGYNKAASADEQLDTFSFAMLTGAGDFYDLINVVDPDSIPDFATMTTAELIKYERDHSRCSALIKMLPGFEDIYFSHSTWFYYAETNRIFKYHDINITLATSKTMSYSSYPGDIVSSDDFYVLGNGLVMLETSNGIYNKSLWGRVNPYSLPSWVRTRTANMMASDGAEWAHIFQQHNSGTYNNQYMILDLRKVHLGQGIDDGALWVIEQIPGLVIHRDQTPILRTGYWPSYNRPFYEEIFNTSGYADLVRRKGTFFSYALGPRAKIFRRDAGKVANLEEMKKIMRYNDYRNDPYSEGDACYTICCRGDLSLTPGLMGCSDSKVANYKMADAREVWVINGPVDGGYIPPFTWKSHNSTLHAGLPEVYEFDWLHLSPLLDG